MRAGQGDREVSPFSKIELKALQIRKQVKNEKISKKRALSQSKMDKTTIEDEGYCTAEDMNIQIGWQPNDQASIDNQQENKQS